VRVNGPYGEFRLSDRDAPILFIAGGSGMAPIKCLLHQMRTTRDPRPATFFFGANTAADLFYRDEMARFERDIPNFRFVPVVARPTEAEAWAGERGLVTEALARHAADISGCEAYLCGSPGMIDAAIKVLAGRGVTEDRIFYDKFA
jgi:Na+-transporting NADH:ubiquinone oxidoreductase subunit F